MTNIYSDPTSELIWAPRLAAFGLPSSGCQGTSAPAAEPFAVVVDALPHVRGKAAVLVPQAQQVADGQINIHNYMTGVIAATGGGASGPPPRDRGPV